MRAPGTPVRLAAGALALAAAACSSVDEPARATHPGAPAVPRTEVQALTADPVIVAAGDIVCGSGTPAGTPCRHAQTAALIGQRAPTAVLLLGDNQYENGTLADYNSYYHPTWGAYRSITYPSPGNHEYNTPNGAGYYDYFNGVGVPTGRAGTRGKGYYSYDLGAWHLIALNSNCSSVGGCGVGSAQEQWLRADLAAHPTACTLAYWHHPRFSSSAHGDNSITQPLWQALMDHHADVVLAGHDHTYERFAPQTATGALDNVNGLRSWVVGTGGKEHYGFVTIRANSQVRDNTSFGLLELTLHPTGYDWRFVPIAGDTFTDAGTATCNGVPANQAPTASITSPANGASFAQGAGVSFAGTGTDAEDGALGGASLVWTSDRDGQIGTGTSFTRTTLSVGTHVVTLTAKDAQGATGSATRTITIAGGGGTAPVARFTIACPTLQCTADASASTDDQGVVSYAWTWGNGSGETKTVPVTKKTYATSGTYTVTLTATDAGGLAGTVSKQVTVPTPAGNQPPTASFTWTCVGLNPHQCAFDASASTDDHGIASYAWTWGNGSGETKSVPTTKKTYASAGTYGVTLTVTDTNGLTASVTKSVAVP